MPNKKPEQPITMTTEEISQLVNERVSAALREAEASRQPKPEPYVPDPIPFQRAPADHAFEAVLLETLDECSGNINEAVLHLYAKINGTVTISTRVIQMTPVAGLRELYETWRRHPVTHQPLYELDERNHLAAYMENLDRRRKVPLEVEIADRTRLLRA